MKKLLTFVFPLLLLASCSGKSELYKQTDAFVASLDKSYDHYGILDATDNAKTTEDGIYRVMPIGRLINVKIEKETSDEEYEDLRSDLESHYKGDSRVNKVYRCEAGTIMIDCRN